MANFEGKERISSNTQMTLFTANGIIWRETRWSSKGIAPKVSQTNKPSLGIVTSLCNIQILLLVSLARLPALTTVPVTPESVAYTLEAVANLLLVSVKLAIKSDPNPLAKFGLN